MAKENKSEGPEDRRSRDREDVWVSFDHGKSWTKEKIQRFKPWRWEIILVAGLSLLIGGVGWLRVGSVAGDAEDAANDATVAVDNAKRAFEATEDFATDLRDSAVRGCKRQNKVRKQQHVVQDIVRSILHDDIEDSRNIASDAALSTSFAASLGLTLHEFHQLILDDIRQQQKHRRELNQKLSLAHCEAVYPDSIKEGSQ